MNLDELVVTIGAKVEQGEFQDVFALVDHIQEAFEKVGEKIKELWGEGFGITDAVANQGAQAQRLAQIYGMTAEQIEQLGWVAKATGGNLEGLLTGMKFLARNTEAAAQGSTEAMHALAGIQTQGPKGLLSMSEILERAAEQFAAMPDGVAKTAKALKLFGRSGTEMIPLLNRGAEGVHELVEEFEDSGAALTQASLAQAQAYVEVKRRVGLAKEGLEVRFGTRNLETQTKLWAALLNLLRSAGVKRVVDALARVFQVLLRGVTAVARGLTWFAAQKGLVEVALYAAAVAFGVMALAATGAGIAAVAAGAKLVGGWIAAALPLWAIAALLVLVGDEIYVTLEGGDSLINRARKWAAEPFTDFGLLDGLRAVIRAVEWLLTPANWSAIGDGARQAFPQLQALADMLDNIVTAWKWLRAGKAGEGLAAGLEWVQEKQNQVSTSLGFAAAPVGGATSPGVAAGAQYLNSRASTVVNQQVTAPITVHVPVGTDAKGVGDHVRAAVREELGKQLQDAHAAHGGDR